MNQTTHDAMRKELHNCRKIVDFDTYDIIVEELARRVLTKKIEIAPAYQRKFRWDTGRQSRLIESILLGIPVPPLFMATNTNENISRTWEVVDGLQRLLSLTHFITNCDNTGLKDEYSILETHSPIRLTELDYLKSIEGKTANDLPYDYIQIFLDQPIKVIVLNDKSDISVRFDLFNRLNTGGIKLTDHELREAAMYGEFTNLLKTLSKNTYFRSTVFFQKGKIHDGTPEEYILRFFAFYDRYKEFDHSVKDFLDDYCKYGYGHPNVNQRTELFEKTFEFLSRAFPNGIRRDNRILTPVNLYEGISVGAALALDMNDSINPHQSLDWIMSDEYKKLITGATNSKRMVTGRIEFARDRFLANG